MAKGRKFRDNTFFNPNFVRDSKLDAFLNVCLRSSVYTPVRLFPGQMVSGVVVHNRCDEKPDEIILDLGQNHKYDGRVITSDLRRMGRGYRSQFPYGSTCDATVWDVDRDGKVEPDEDCFLPVSLTYGRLEDDIVTLRRLQRTNETIEVFAYDYSFNPNTQKGGLKVRWGGVNGFVPLSQLADLPSYRMSIDEAIQYLQGRVRHPLQVKIILIQENTQDQDEQPKGLDETPAPEEKVSSLPHFNVRFSEKLALLDNLGVGQEVLATVTYITDYGAFVEFTVKGNKFNGLIHKSEISLDWVDDPHDFLEVGQVVPVIITNIDYIESEISLSAKRVLEQPQRIQHFIPRKKKLYEAELEDFGPEKENLIETEEELLTLAEVVCEKLGLTELNPQDYIDKYGALVLILEAGLDKGWHELAIALRIRKAILNSANWREALEILEDGLDVSLSGHKASFTLFYFLVKRQNKENKE